MDRETATSVFLQIVEFHLGYDGEPADKRIDEIDADVATNLVHDVEATFLGEIDRSGAVFESIWTNGTLADVLAIALANWDGSTLVGVQDGTWIDPPNRA
jgi:hypothetical protein